MIKRRPKTSCGIHPRATAEDVGDGRARFTYPCGYVSTEYVFNARDRKLMRGPNPAGASILVRTWRSTGVSKECPRCARRGAAEKKETR